MKKQEVSKRAGRYGKRGGEVHLRQPCADCDSSQVHTCAGCDAPDALEGLASAALSAGYETGVADALGVLDRWLAVARDPVRSGLVLMRAELLLLVGGVL